MSRDWKGKMGPVFVVWHKVSVFGHKYKGHLVGVLRTLGSVGNVVLSITGVKESNIWLDCLRWVAKAGFLNPTVTLLEMIDMSYAWLPFMCAVNIRKISAIDYSMVTEVILENWKILSICGFAAQYAAGCAVCELVDAW
jgi:hypothetical protein